MCLHLPGKLREPIAHPFPLIAQSVFGSPQIRAEYTSSRIQLNCLNTHGALAWVCLDGLCHNGEFHPTPPPPPPRQRRFRGRAVGEGWRVCRPGAMSVALRKGQKEDISGLKVSLSFWNRWTYIPSLPYLDMRHNVEVAESATLLEKPRCASAPWIDSVFLHHTSASFSLTDH